MEKLLKELYFDVCEKYEYTKRTSRQAENIAQCAYRNRDIDEWIKYEMDACYRDAEWSDFGWFKDKLKDILDRAEIEVDDE